MSNRTNLFKFLTGNQKIETGVIVRVGDDSILTATSKGLKEFPLQSTAGLRESDKVRFKGDLYLGKLRTNPQSKVYSV